MFMWPLFRTECFRDNICCFGEYEVDRLVLEIMSEVSEIMTAVSENMRVGTKTVTSKATPRGLFYQKA